MSKELSHIHLEITISEDGSIEQEELYSTEDGSDVKSRLQPRELTMNQFITFMTALRSVGQEELQMVSGLRER